MGLSVHIPTSAALTVDRSFSAQRNSLLAGRVAALSPSDYRSLNLFNKFQGGVAVRVQRALFRSGNQLQSLFVSLLLRDGDDRTPEVRQNGNDLGGRAHVQMFERKSSTVPSCVGFIERTPFLCCSKIAMSQRTMRGNVDGALEFDLCVPAIEDGQLYLHR